MENPNHKGGATAAQLKEYAHWRAEREAKDNAALLAKVRAGMIETAEDDEEHRQPLCIDTAIELNITLSTGGDADGYTITLSKEGEVECGVYYWADWGCYEEVKLSDKELDDVVDLYLCGDPSAFINS